MKIIRMRVPPMGRPPYRTDDPPAKPPLRASSASASSRFVDASDTCLALAVSVRKPASPAEETTTMKPGPRWLPRLVTPALTEDLAPRVRRGESELTYLHRRTEPSPKSDTKPPPDSDEEAA